MITIERNDYVGTLVITEESLKTKNLDAIKQEIKPPLPHMSKMEKCKIINHVVASYYDYLKFKNLLITQKL